MTDFDSEELLLSSCDDEVAAINGSTLEVISEDEEEPDSWDALHRSLLTDNFKVAILALF